VAQLPGHPLFEAGASVELLQPFVDALDPVIEVIRFDVPEVSGSPAASHPYPWAAGEGGPANTPNDRPSPRQPAGGCLDPRRKDI
jgi:hypothetical protein